MSRIGKNPIPIPKDVQFTEKEGSLLFKGPHGQLTHRLPSGFTLKRSENLLTLIRPSDEPKDKAFHGLHRTLLANKIIGVSVPFKKVLELNGVGYRAQLNSNILTLSVGFTHPVEFALPDGIKASVEKQTIITLTSSDKELLGQFAADVRSVRPPEPYKGKGIKYSGEKILRKEGKTGKK
ncbi:MAG: 50S ribosomal protein L6 [Leptospirales bacterium]